MSLDFNEVIKNMRNAAANVLKKTWMIFLLILKIFLKTKKKHSKY